MLIQTFNIIQLLTFFSKAYVKTNSKTFAPVSHCILYSNITRQIFLLKRIRIIYTITLCCLLGRFSYAQIEVKGTVYDATQRIPLENIMVLSYKGVTTFTDSLGNYNINLAPDDSLYFSYEGKGTKKYLAKDIPHPYAFDMSLKVTIKNALPNVIVRPKTYRLDSMENRADYAKIFDYQKPNPLRNINVGGGAVGIDPNDVINAFRFKYNKRMQVYQNHLIMQEQDKYVNYRFNKSIVKKLTKLSGAALDTFMVRYRPSYYFVQASNDLELYQYIWTAGKQYALAERKQY
jgi:hypothetical protein